MAGAIDQAVTCADDVQARAIHGPRPAERLFAEAAGKMKILASDTPKRGKRRAG